MSISVVASRTHTYHGEAEINFFSDDQEGLSVTIDTERCHIRSVEAKEEEYDRYAALFGSKEVMEKFAAGETKTLEEMKERVSNFWAQRWYQHNPYSGLAVFKRDTDEFLGHIVLDHCGAPGRSELSYLFHHAYWGKGYGSESVTAVVKEYAPATVTEGYLLDKKPLDMICATVRQDNPASIRILQKVGMQLIEKKEKYGVIRDHYSINLAKK